MIGAPLLLAALLAVEEPAVAETYPLVLLVQGDASDDGFRLRRLRIGDDVRAGAWHVRAVVEGRGAGAPAGALEGGRIPAAGSMRLTDTFVAFAPHRALEIAAGSLRVPFSLSRQVDEADLRLPERALVVDAATPDLRAGVAVGGDLGLLQYRAALMSADASLDGALLDSGALFALRVGAEPIGPVGVAPWRRRRDDPWASWWRFSAGASLLAGTLAAPRTLGTGVDGQLQAGRLTAAAEYLFVRVRGGGPTQQGAALEPGFALWPERLDLVVRGSWARLGGADTLGAGGGLTLYTHHARLRWQVGLEHRWGASVGAAGDGWAVARLALAI
jgi:hypothetical protein